MACMGSKGKGRMGELSYTDPRFSLGTYVPMQRTRNPTDDKETLIYIFKKYMPCPFPLTTTHPKTLPTKEQTQVIKVLPLQATGKGSRGELSYIWTSMFHYVSTSPSKGLGITWNNTQNAANIYIYLKNVYNQAHPPANKATKHLFYHCPPGNEGWGVWDIFHRVNLNVH